MTKRLFVFTLVSILTVACSGQRQAVKNGTSLTTTDLGGVQTAADIPVQPADQTAAGTKVKESDELLPSNSDDLNDDPNDGDGSGDGLTDGQLEERSRKAHGGKSKGPKKSGGAAGAGLRKNITVGVAVAGENTQNGGTSFIPASITKLITTGIALETLGPNFHFTHTFSYRWLDKDAGVIGNLKWVDEGDPSLGNRFFSKFGKKQMPTLETLSKQLRAAGITAIKGKIQLVASDSRLDAQTSAPGVEDSDRRSFFGAFMTSFTYLHNFPKRSPSAGKDFVHAAFIKSLKASHITVDETADGSGGVAAVTKLQSPALKDLIIPMNKASDNLIADTLFMTIALRHAADGQSLNDAGRAFYMATLHKWMRSEGTPRLADELNFYDGSGLSRNDRVTAEAFLGVLKYYVKQSYFQAIFDSLPIAGVDGTLGSRMSGPATRGRVHAKTGTVRGNYQLAGFIPRLNGDGRTAHAFVPFVVLTKTPDGASYRFAAHAYQDEIVTRLATQIND